MLTLDADGRYSASFSYTIPDAVGVYDCIPTAMQPVVMVHGPLDKPDARVVYNADHVSVSEE